MTDPTDEKLIAELEESLKRPSEEKQTSEETPLLDALTSAEKRFNERWNESDYGGAIDQRIRRVLEIRDGDEAVQRMRLLQQQLGIQQQHAQQQMVQEQRDSRLGQQAQYVAKYSLLSSWSPRTRRLVEEGVKKTEAELKALNESPTAPFGPVGLMFRFIYRIGKILVKGTKW